MANEKVWTPADRDAAATKLCIGGREAGVAFFGRHPHLGFAVAEDLQCELTEAKELLHKLSKSREFLLYLADSGFAKEVYGWLERNTGGHDGR